MVRGGRKGRDKRRTDVERRDIDGSGRYVVLNYISTFSRKVEKEAREARQGE